ncbi:DUF3797 domain-containing protein [Paenibacillus elgii]|uniref:DUF3797 domain-containing protein n=1 Tax=Paenibacillus elgii TaxID=189691 RepID=UPI0009EE5E22|nr:DUF3797 domain-containing protein [Paenibacillus elgii]
MNAWKAVRLMRKYENCKDCGNDLIGDGEGTLEINGDTFKRSCKCGWSIEVKEGGGRNG